MARMKIQSREVRPETETATATFAAHPLVQKALPWVAGAGMALGHAAVSSNCTVPRQGRCAACGSCILVVGSLVAWAWLKQRRGDDFYTQR